MFNMSPRRGSRKMGDSKSERKKGSLRESNEDSDDSNGCGTPLDDSSGEGELENGEEYTFAPSNEKCASWWARLSKKTREGRLNCIKIHMLSPFLFGVVPPGQEDKVIDWSFECNLLPSMDIQPVFSPTNRTFESIRIVENAFDLLAHYCESKGNTTNVLTAKDEIIKVSSFKTAMEYVERFEWFILLRSRVKLIANSGKEMGDMSLLLAIYHFAGHIQLSVIPATDVLKRYKEDCKLAEEKALELKVQGNKQFSSDKYRAAISLYSTGVGLSPFNYIVYGNRAQSYLKLENYRQALIDAKRAVVLQPDWDKGQYRFNQAAKALQESEGEKASFLTFFIGPKKLELILKENSASVNKGKNSATSKGKSTCSGDDDDSDGENLPEFVSADDCDTTVEEDGFKIEKETDMPDLVDEDEDSDESSLDEKAFELLSAEKKQGFYARRERKMNNKLAALTRQKQAQEDKAKKVQKEEPKEKPKEKQKRNQKKNQKKDQTKNRKRNQKKNK